MTWLASSCIGKATPSSEEKEDIGERVPDVNTMERALAISVKACMRTRIIEWAETMVME